MLSVLCYFFSTGLCIFSATGFWPRETSRMFRSKIGMICIRLLKTFIFLWSFSTLGCASSKYIERRGSVPPAQKSNARGAAYTVDGFRIDKVQRSGGPTENPFFYKDCDLSRRAHFSKADYDCRRLTF